MFTAYVTQNQGGRRGFHTSARPRVHERAMHPAAALLGAGAARAAVLQKWNSSAYATAKSAPAVNSATRSGSVD